jgi:hypothetical protein
MGLAAEKLRRLLIQQDHPFATISQLAGCCEPGNASPHNDHIRVVVRPIRHLRLPVFEQPPARSRAFL